MPGSKAAVEHGDLFYELESDGLNFCCVSEDSQRELLGGDGFGERDVVINYISFPEGSAKDQLWGRKQSRRESVSSPASLPFSNCRTGTGGLWNRTKGPLRV